MVYKVIIELTLQADSEEQAVAMAHASQGSADVVSVTATELPPIIGQLNITETAQRLT